MRRTGINHHTIFYVFSTLSVGARRGPLDRPRGSLVAPDGSPASSKCEEQLSQSEILRSHTIFSRTALQRCKRRTMLDST